MILYSFTWTVERETASTRLYATLLPWFHNPHSILFHSIYIYTINTTYILSNVNIHSQKNLLASARFFTMAINVSNEIRVYEILSWKKVVTIFFIVTNWSLQKTNFPPSWYIYAYERKLTQQQKRCNHQYAKIGSHFQGFWTRFRRRLDRWYPWLTFGGTQKL